MKNDINFFSDDCIMANSQQETTLNSFTIYSDNHFFVY